MAILGSIFTIVCSYFLIKGWLLLREVDQWRAEMRKDLEAMDLGLSNMDSEILDALKTAGLAPKGLKQLNLKGTAIQRAQEEAKKRPGVAHKIQGTNLAIISSGPTQLKGTALKSKKG